MHQEGGELAADLAPGVVLVVEEAAALQVPPLLAEAVAIIERVLAWTQSKLVEAAVLE